MTDPTVTARRGGTQVVGNVGMYYAAYRLSQMGWNVMPTARNARGIDLLAYDATASRFLGIQIKALSIRNPVPLGNSIDRFIGDWWIIVAKAATEPKCFIMKPAEVRRLANPSKEGAKVSYWLPSNRYDTDEFREAWHRIGRGDGI
jgi:hypothetical protein